MILNEFPIESLTVNGEPIEVVVVQAESFSLTGDTRPPVLFSRRWWRLLFLIVGERFS